MAERDWKKISLKILVPLLTLLVGATLLLSGIVKAIDPAGMCIKLEAYCQSWGLPFSASSLTLKLSTGALALIETFIGVNLLLGIRRRITSKVAAAFMFLLTVFSLYIYIAEPVSDCGCFGAAAKLTNGQTLLKNCFLLPASVVVALFPLYMPRVISKRSQWITDVWTALFCIGLTIYSLHFLPPVDFTAFREGADVRKAFMGEIEDSDGEQLASFFVMTPQGDDVTDSLLSLKGDLLLLTLPDESHADDGCNDRINDLYDYAQDAGLPFYAIAADEARGWDEWKDRTGAAYEVLVGEKSQLRSLVRSNPGLVLMRNGTIWKKWSNNDLPTIETAAQLKTVEPASSRIMWLKLFSAFLIPLLGFCFADQLWSRLRMSVIRARRKKIAEENEKPESQL